MTEFKVGDIVRMTRGEPGRPGHGVQVREVSHDRAIPGMIEPYTLRAYEREGWTVELVERPAPPLPTTPNTIGWATVSGVRSLARLGVFGQWETYSSNGALGAKPHPSTIEDFTECVLIPKELADKITAWTADPFRRGATIGATLNRIADYLKGQE